MPGARSSVPMDRKFMALLIAICVCGKVTIVDRGWGWGR